MINDALMHILPTIEHFRGLGYWIAFLSALLESLVLIGVFVPGTTVILLFGLLASQGTFDLGDLLWFVCIGAIFGDGVSFYLGRRGQHYIYVENKLFRKEHLEKAQAFFQRHGGKSVFIGRFVGPMRAIIPFIAGMSGMPGRVFVLWNVSSALIWAFTFLLLGYFFGHALQAVETWSTRIGLALLVLAGCVAAIYWLQRLLVRYGKQAFALTCSVGKSMLRGAWENPDLQRHVRRHPKFFHFLKMRWQADTFSGRPLTLLGIVFLYIAMLFFGVIENFLTSGSIVAIDVQLENLLYLFRAPELIRASLWISLFGNTAIVVSMAVAVSFLCWLHRKSRYILPLWLAIFGSSAFGWLGKIAFHRPRPALAVYIEPSFSFPSSHAIIAAAFYGFLTYILTKQASHWKRKVKFTVAGISAILAIGASRIYLAVHFLSDVWAGYLLGTLWLIFAISLVEREEFRWRGTTTRSQPPTRQTWWLSGGIIAAEVAFYLMIGFHYAPPYQLPELKPDAVISDGMNSFFLKNRLSPYTETLTGRKQEPLNVLIFAKDDAQLFDAFRRAGWFQADDVSVSSLFWAGKAAALNSEYLTAPISPYFWETRPQDIGVQKPTSAQSVRVRHHARFWSTSYITPEGMRLYVGTTSLDIGLKWGVTHKIQPDIDTERDLLTADVSSTGMVQHVEEIQLVAPTLGKNEFGDQFFTNGMCNVIYLTSK